MARSVDAMYTNYPLPKDSSALADLDAFCREWGDISRADATQRIIIAWAKARHGDLSAFGAMGITPPLAAPAPPTSMEPSETRGQIAGKRPLNGNARAVELDL